MAPVRARAPQSVPTAKRPIKPRVTRAKLAAALLDLQRAAGNAAVVAHLADAGTGKPAAPLLPPIQRCGPTPCDCSDEQRADYSVTHGDESVVQRDVTDDLAEFIAKDLAEYTAQNRDPFQHILGVFHGLDSDIEDNVAAAFVAKLGPQELEGFAVTKQGQSVMDVLTEAMLTGHVTSFEALQADRILAARSRWMSADEHDKAVRRIAALRYHAEDSAGQMAANELALNAATSLATLAAGRRYDEVTAILRDTYFKCRRQPRIASDRVAHHPAAGGDGQGCGWDDHARRVLRRAHHRLGDLLRESSGRPDSRGAREGPHLPRGLERCGFQSGKFELLSDLLAAFLYLQGHAFSSASSATDPNLHLQIGMLIKVAYDYANCFISCCCWAKLQNGTFPLCRNARPSLLAVERPPLRCHQWSRCTAQLTIHSRPR